MATRQKLALTVLANVLGASAGIPIPVSHFLVFKFCTGVHSFPQLSLEILLAKKKRQVYCLAQIEPGSLKNLTAQLKEGAAAARLLRLRCFVLDNPLSVEIAAGRINATRVKVYR